MNGSLSESWAKLTDKYLALNQRERWMVGGAVVCVFYALFSFLVSPTLDKQKLMNAEIANDSTKLEALTLELNSYTNKNAVDPDASLKQQIASLESNLNVLQTKIDDLKNTLIKPEKMPDLLSDLLKNNANLKLVSLKTLPIKDLIEKDASSATPQQHAQEEKLPIFKHGVELTIEGRYLDLLDYVAGVEKMPWDVLWERANLSVDDKSESSTPLSQLTLTVYTLSLDKTWLSI